MKCKFKGCGATLKTPKGFQRHMMKHVETDRNVNECLKYFDEVIIPYIRDNLSLPPVK